MRYLALVVGIAMIAIGLLAEVGSILFFSGLGLGSFECTGPACDFLGPWPLFMGGGIVLIVIDEQVRHAALVPQRALSRLTTGARLPVRVDPLDASQLIVEWDKG